MIEVAIPVSRHHKRRFDHAASFIDVDFPGRASDGRRRPTIQAIF